MVVYATYPGRGILEVFVQVPRKFGANCCAGHRYRYDPTFPIAKCAFHPVEGGICAAKYSEDMPPQKCFAGTTATIEPSHDDDFGF